MSLPIVALAIRHAQDVVLARQRARCIAELLGFDGQDQTRIATAVSEIARNAFRYAGGGRIDFTIEGTRSPQLLVVVVTDAGRGIADVELVLSGRYRSDTGMGLGLLGAQRLMDRFDVASTAQGTTVTLKKLLPREARSVGAAEIARIAEALARERAQDWAGEIQQQNQELLRTLDELGKRQDELVALNRELEDTNRGVVALYAELDEKADHLRRADDIKSRFLSNMSHEFRTPVNSIQALSRMLLDRTDGPLTAEQETQVAFIRKAADALSDLVNDLLDLAKVEAGKIVVRPVDFEVPKLFGALRGMLRPLLVSETVTLVFEDPEDMPTLNTDEAKVSQILRNFISNALKFTERGEVRVSAEVVEGGDAVAFRVTDTGIGIAPADQERVFQEFTQIDNPIQRHVKGTGLGLPLCRKLADLLGGSVSVESELGIGSTFTATIPIIYESSPLAPAEWHTDTERIPVLVVEDSAETIHVYERFLGRDMYQVLSARTLREARDALTATRPRAIILDIVLRGEDSWSFLAETKRNPSTSDIPIVVITTVEEERKGLALGADAYIVKPIERAALVETLGRLTTPSTMRRVLIVDDEEISRYVLRQHLISPDHMVREAASGAEGIRLARAERPDVVCLDLVMPDLDGFEVLRRLKADPATRDIPVVIVTSKPLSEEERGRLALAADVVAKDGDSRERARAAIERAMDRGGKAA